MQRLGGLLTMSTLTLTMPPHLQVHYLLEVASSPGSYYYFLIIKPYLLLEHPLPSCRTLCSAGNNLGNAYLVKLYYRRRN